MYVVLVSCLVKTNVFILFYNNGQGAVNLQISYGKSIEKPKEALLWPPEGLGNAKWALLLRARKPSFFHSFREKPRRFTVFFTAMAVVYNALQIR